MKRPAASAAASIDAKIKEPGDWRGKTLAKVRECTDCLEKNGGDNGTRTRGLYRDSLGINVLSATYILAGAAQVAEKDCRNRLLWVNLWVRIFRWGCVSHILAISLSTALQEPARDMVLAGISSRCLGSCVRLTIFGRWARKFIMAETEALGPTGGSAVIDRMRQRRANGEHIQSGRSVRTGQTTGC